MNCSNKITDLLKALCAIFVTLVSVNACTDVDDRLGANLLPKHQQMQIRVGMFEGVKTYLYKEDSLVSSNISYVYYGREKDAVWGGRTNGFVVQFLPASIPYDKGFGLRPIVDSLYLVLPLYDVSGDTTQVQNFEIWEIKGPEYIYPDSTYYSSFPVEDYLGEKLFTFSHTGKRDVATRLVPTAAGVEYLYSITALDSDTYKDDSLFHLAYNGLYVKPTAGSPAFAATYSAALASAYMQLHTRCYDTVDVSAILDTFATQFSFYNGTLSTNIPFKNASINIVDFDYAGSQLGSLEAATNSFTDTLPSSPTQSLIYVQPMGGVTGYMRFTDELIAQLKNLRTEGTVTYPDIMINQAAMYIWLDDDSTPVMNTSVKRLGSYLDLQKFIGIPDYQYYSEWYARQQESTKDYQLPYNGYLNRSNGYYMLDITSYVQQLAKGKVGDPLAIQPVFHIAPEAYGYFSFGQSILKGYGSDSPIEIRLTYTLIE